MSIAADLRLDVSVRSANLRPHLLQRLQVQIHRPRPNRASSRQRNPRHSHARHQRPQRQHRRPHRLHQLIGRFRVIQLRRLDHVIAARKLRDRHLRVHERQQLAHGDQVAHLGNVVQRHLLRRQQSRRHHRKRRILRPADRHRPPQRLPALNQELIHALSLCSSVVSICRVALQRDLLSFFSPRLCVLRVSALSLSCFFPCISLPTLPTLPSNRHPLPSISFSPPPPPLQASTSPARLSNCVPPPAKRVPPQTHSSRSPPPVSAVPGPQAFHLSARHQSSSFHRHVPAAPSLPYSACSAPSFATSPP